MTTVLSDAEVVEQLAGRGLSWDLADGCLIRSSRHGDFAGALAYVNRVGALAEAAGHHPDISISWATVTLRLSTHSAGGITEADLSLAAAIDGLEDAAGSPPGGAG